MKLHEFKWIRKEIKNTLAEMDSCATVWIELPNGYRENICYNLMEGRKRRDAAVRLRGEMNPYMRQLVDDSNVRKYYQAVIDRLDDFISRMK